MMKSSPVWIMLVFLILPVPKAEAGTGTYGDLERLPGMIESRYNHTSTVVEGGILVTGGTSDGSDSLSSCEILDIETGSWMEAPAMRNERMRHTADLLENGSVLVAGGFAGKGHPSLFGHFNGSGNHSLSTCEILHPGSNEWTSFPPLITGRFWHASIMHPELGLIVLGGSNATHGTLSSCERLGENGWEKFPELPQPLVRFAYCVLEDGDILVAGGHEGIKKISTDRCYRFDIDSFEWIEAPSMIHARGYPGFLKLEDGRFVVSGGFSEPGQPDRSDSEYFDPEINRWIDMGDLLFPRHGHGMVEVPERFLIIAGGSNCETGGCHSNLEIYDVEDGKWVDSGHLIMGRKWCGVSMIDESTLVVTGGRACNYPTADTDVLGFSVPQYDNQSEYADVDPASIILATMVIILIIMCLYLYIKKAL